MYIGNLLKMYAEPDVPVSYKLKLGENEIAINELIGSKIRIRYKDQINCIKCGRETKTSFAQGYCYPCFTTAPETEECVLRPELCMAHEGKARDMEYATEHCLNDHIVYLAVSSGLKVGVTRISQVPTRWIDQGAWKAIRLAVTPNRYLAGCIEVALKEHINDKTNWRHMLMNKHDETTDLVKEKDRAIELLHIDFQEYASDNDEITELTYPVLQYPSKVKSLSLDKSGVIEEYLSGIKGQYLIFESGSVLNIRKHNGYLVELEKL